MTTWASRQAIRQSTTAATSATLLERVAPVSDTASRSWMSETQAEPAVQTSVPLSFADPSVQMCISLA